MNLKYVIYLLLLIIYSIENIAFQYFFHYQCHEWK